jgi:hypothetical protein
VWPLGLGWKGREAVEGVRREVNKMKRNVMGDTEVKTMSVINELYTNLN